MNLLGGSVGRRRVMVPAADARLGFSGVLRVRIFFMGFYRKLALNRRYADAKKGRV
jgi:hypothetical protein